MGNCRTEGRPSGACPLWAGQLSTERCSGPFSFRIVLLYFVLIRYHTAIQYDTQAVFVTYRCPVGCSFLVKHRADASPSARCRPAVERKAELSARRPAPARNGPTARFEKVRKGAGRATSRKRRHGPPVRSSAVRVFEWRGGQANRGINGG